jgi:hypothetical protein
MRASHKLWSLKMSGNAARFVQLGGGLVGLVVLGCVLTGQAARPARLGIPLPTDWSHSHLIFSQPSSIEQAMRLEQDLRFEQQLYRRYQPQRLPAAELEREGVSSPELRYPVLLSQKPQGLWEEDLGAGSTVGSGNFPAKFSLSSSTASCASDFVVFSTGLTGTTGGQASIVAYNNLYSGCTGGVPAAYWAYNTGGQILTSPVFSRDGSQIAFAQTSGGLGSLVLLRWKASTGTVGASVAPTSETPATYLGCTAPCMTTIALEDGSLIPTNDTTSSVFYNYGGDIAWVGDNRGWLHQFTGVFLGTPAEVRTIVAPIWPAQMNSGGPLPLASPVYDHGSGSVFVGDEGGYFYQVNATSAAVTQSSQIDFGTGIVAGPLVDSTSGLAYVFASSDGGTGCAGGPCAKVHLFATGFGAGTAGTNVTVGASAASPNPLYEGAFDSAYDSSGNATGDLYVCGNTGGDPTVYQVQIAAGVLGSVITGPALSTAATGCAPVSHVLNPNATGGSTEFIFASVQNHGTTGSCGGGGCVMNFKSTPWTALTAYTLGQEVVDTHFQVQMVNKAGTSGSSAPSWSTVVGATTTDGIGAGAANWLNLGVTTAATPAAWQASHAYAVGKYIEDTNFNIEVVTAIIGTGHSKAGAHPTWKTLVGQTTTDNHVTWTNAGPAPGAVAAAGGTSAVIIDNTVGTGTEAGASQIYFQTQSNQTCTTSGGTGGCAVQASQSALK